MEIAASLLDVEKENAVQTFYDLESAQIDYFHIDVMDGKFVENNTDELMQDDLDIMTGITNNPIEIHFMVNDIKKYIDKYKVYNPQLVYFHYETSKNKTPEYICYLKELGIKVGIAINIETKLEDIYEFLPFIHNVLVMSVKPGKGGQKFMPEALERITILKKYINEKHLDTVIAVDGGVNDSNILEIKNRGAEIAVVGSFLMKCKDLKFMVKKLKNI